MSGDAYGRAWLFPRAGTIIAIVLPPCAPPGLHRFSGGQYQRVAIARALVMDPDVIPADAPTGNLDSKTGEETMGVFAELNHKGKTTVMVTHEGHIARCAGRTVQLVDGRIVGPETQHEKGNGR